MYNMEKALLAISPIDGRYIKQTESLQQYFSEFALMRFRVWVEAEYLLLLGELNLFKLPPDVSTLLKELPQQFSLEDAEAIKKIERTTNHDVKAVEYFIKEKLEAISPGNAFSEFTHFGLTSQDVNNTAIPLSWKLAMENEYLPAMLNLHRSLARLAKPWMKQAMLARTHGQPASPTTMGKEWMVFVERLENQLEQFTQIPYAAKFGGATGNFNAHKVAYPKINWIEQANHFVNERLGLQRMQYTTQIEHYDSLAAHFDAMKRINVILIDFCRDVWTYISMDYFKQKTKEGEVGSSAMPHKVNPIDFENAEGNLGMANALFEHLSAKLPISRLQRDLTDSTVLRNIGVPVAHTLIAVKSIEKGLSKLILNEQKLHNDLESNWAVVAEAIQTVLRRENYPQPYEALKKLTRGTSGINQKSLHKFIDSLKIKASVKTELKKITPHNYTGYHGG